MKYHKEKMMAEIKVDDDYPYTICEFSENLDEDAKLKFATQMEYMEELYNHVEEMFDDGYHIAVVLDNLERLNNIRKRYNKTLFERKRKDGI